MRCDEGVHIFSWYVYGSVRKVRRGYELVRNESLSSNPYKIAICRLKLLNTELVLVYHSTHTDVFFEKSLVAFFKRFLVHTMVTRTHIL